MESDNRNEIRRDGADKPRPRSIYERAGNDGAWMGLLFTLIFGLSVVGMRFAMLNIVVLTMILTVPYLAYRFMRRTFTDSHGLVTFSGLWMQGILTFAAGALILGASSFVFMRWIQPEFLVNTVKTGVEFYRGLPSGAGAELADEFQKIIDNKMIPSAAAVAAAWIWLCVFSGSMLSLLLSAIIRLIPIKNSNK